MYYYKMLGQDKFKRRRYADIKGLLQSSVVAQLAKPEAMTKPKNSLIAEGPGASG